jgi:putative ATPase
LTGELFPEAADHEEKADRGAPLAARMRPRTLDELVGQEHVVGPGSPLRALIETDRLSSIILWGPPGTGKTSLATIVARATRAHHLDQDYVEQPLPGAPYHRPSDRGAEAEIGRRLDELRRRRGPAEPESAGGA